jgi:hypothetical protein
MAKRSAIIPCCADVTNNAASGKKPGSFGLTQAYGGNPMGRPLVAEVEGQLWKNGQELNVYFLDGNSNQKDAVEAAAKEWERYANIAFKFHTKKPRNAQISVTFRRGGFSSYRGKSCEHFANRGEPSMVLQDTDERRHILHELGHALGLYHEHQNPKGKISWDRKAVYKYFKDTQGWDKDTVDINILNPATSTSVVSSFDPESIMLYAFPANLTTNGFSTEYNSKLSKTDKLYIARLYPKRPCKKCGGKGYILVKVGGAGGFPGKIGVTTIAVCTTCKGTGNN